jgi:hypothetical protein
VTGQLVAQGIYAAMSTVDKSYVLHSLHSYFIRPADTKKVHSCESNPHNYSEHSWPLLFQDIFYYVDRLLDGRSFANRGVRALQNGKVVFFCNVSFQKPEPSPLVRCAFVRVVLSELLCVTLRYDLTDAPASQATYRYSAAYHCLCLFAPGADHEPDRAAQGTARGLFLSSRQ